MADILLNPDDIRFNTVSDRIAQSTIAASGELVLLACQVKDTPLGREYISNLRRELDGAQIDITYTDAMHGTVGAAGPFAHHARKRLSLAPLAEAV